MKKSFFALTLAVAMLLVSACNDKEVASDVIVTTKTGDITKEELYKEMKDSIGIKVIENLILQKAIETEFKVDEDELNDEIKKQKEAYGDTFPQYLEQNNMTEDFFKKQIEFSILQRKLIGSLEEPSSDEINAEYEKMSNEIHARHILVDKKETAEEVIQKLKDGGDFSELAKEYSTEKNADTSGGDLGWFGVGKMVKPFEDIAFTLSKNEISEPVQSKFGYHVIEVLETREVEMTKTLDDLKPEIEETLKKILFEEKLTALLKGAEIDIKDEDFKSALDGYLNSSEK